MKKLKLLLLALGLTLFATAQINQVNIVNLTVKNSLPGNIDSWMTVPGALLMTAQKSPNSRGIEPRMVVQIKSGGAVICGNTPGTARPVDPFDVRTFNTADLTGFFANCKTELKEGNYSLCVQFFNIDKVAISREVCKEFRVESANTEYAPPTLITPDNEKKFSVAEIQRPVIFRWTPLVPKPKEPVKYRLRVWQLMQGQTGTQAMRSNQPIITKDVDNITQVTVTNILTGPCKPPYLCDFIWNVQALNRNDKPIGNNNGNSEPWMFRVEETTDNKAPQNVFPENSRKMSLEDGLKPINFRWTAVEPKPSEPVRYKLKVWQLMEGQTNEQAMRSNKPVLEKEVNDLLEASGTILTGPCKPPYLCEFIWNVQAVNREGRPVGENEGNSQPTAFSIMTQYIIQLDSLKVECTNTPGQYTFSYIITNQNNTVAQFQNINLYSSVPAGATITSYTPALGTTIAASGGTLTVTGIINGSPSLNIVCIQTKIQKLGDPGKNAEDYLCDTIAPCRCDACDEKHFTLNAPKPSAINWSNTNGLQFNQPITVTTTPPKTIKTITAELVYFEMVPQSDECLPCDKESPLYGHFPNGTNSQQWNGPQSSLNINISTPKLVACCSATFRWCIRYKIEFTDCTSCNKVVCYEKKKEGCTSDGGNH